jgi:hypothetical protein
MCSIEIQGWLKATLYSIQQSHVTSSRHPGRNQGHGVRCWCSGAVTLSSTMRTGGFKLGSSAPTSSTLNGSIEYSVTLRLRILGTLHQDQSKFVENPSRQLTQMGGGGGSYSPKTHRNSTSIQYVQSPPLRHPSIRGIGGGWTTPAWRYLSSTWEICVVFRYL